MTRTLRPLAAALAMVAMSSVGCGGSDGTSTAASHNTAATPREKAVRFSECMRQNGYREFPDPKASGEFPDFGISVTPAVFTKALTACKELQPPGSFSAHMSPEELAAARKFAQCVRAHGITDFPDPVQDEPLIDTTKIPSASTAAGIAILDAATEKCSDVMGDIFEDAAGSGG